MYSKGEFRSFFQLSTQIERKNKQRNKLLSLQAVPIRVAIRVILLKRRQQPQLFPSLSLQIQLSNMQTAQTNWPVAPTLFPQRVIKLYLCHLQMKIICKEAKPKEKKQVITPIVKILIQTLGQTPSPLDQKMADLTATI